MKPTTKSNSKKSNAQLKDSKVKSPSSFSKQNESRLDPIASPITPKNEYDFSQVLNNLRRP